MNQLIHTIYRAPRRWLSVPALLCTLLMTALLANGQPKSYPLVRTPQGITAIRTLPGNTLPAGVAMPANFSKEPTDEEIYRVHFFEEPLVPTDTPALAGENAALVKALVAWSQRNNPDDFAAPLSFLHAWPRSRWRGSLQASLGIVYRRTGYFNQALDSWTAAWQLLKGVEKGPLKVLADRVASELLLLHAWVGRYEQMDSLLSETKLRTMEGPAAERMVTVKEGRWLMETNPGISFKCGPFALNALYCLQKNTTGFNELLTNIQSTDKGFSLSDLARMAGDIGLSYQMAFRTPGSAVLPRAVVHWKLDHYSALIDVKDGSIHCEDATLGTTYGPQSWLTPAALDSSASGYFLVPAGPLPAGWRTVSAGEGMNIYGKGQVPADKGQHVSDDDEQLPKCEGETPMAQSNVHASSVSLHIYDRPLYYTPPKGPAVTWDVDYHQRDSYQPANFSYSNLGAKWTHQWLSYVQDNPNSQTANATVYLMGGGARIFTGYNTTTKSYAPEVQTSDVLVRLCPTCYELRHPDGSKEVYARPDGNTANGRKIFLTQRVDAAGNILEVLYDADLRITALKDALGQVTTVSYEHNTDKYKITKVTDPFSRTTEFTYNAQGLLSSIKDMIGIVSSFHYSTGDFVDEMTTPYGKTKFLKTEGPGNTRVLETHYPQGEKERVEFKEQATGILTRETLFPTTSVIPIFNGYFAYRNTFYWDRKAMQEAPGNYTKARIYHWLHGTAATGENGSTSPMLECVKAPNENKVWYYYQNQNSAGYANQGMSSRPSVIGRVMDDGSSQFFRATYNPLGAVTSTTDPIGRKFTYVYDSTNINLLEVRQSTGTSNELLTKYTYNKQFLPLTITDASGQTTTYTYNAAGQPTSITNARNEKTTYVYDDNGYLKEVKAPTGGITSISYDGYGRVRTIKDPGGFETTTDYDALDRPTVTTYPDGTFEQIVYEKLNATLRRDRSGKWTVTTYDSLSRPIKVEDAKGGITQYQWCNCGSLSAIIDPLKRVTSFTRDLQGRLIEKKYPDGKLVTYKYESTTNRIKQIEDARGQKTQYSYYPDNMLKQISYADAKIPTPSVNFTYDSRFTRLASMTDGSGVTNFSYIPIATSPVLGAGRLQSIDGPLLNDVITYDYDTLGREVKSSINGIASISLFDSLGRVVQISNALGTFQYGYNDRYNRISSLAYPNGQVSNMSYYDAAGNLHLKDISNRTPGNGQLSTFGYNYDSERQITHWSQQSGTLRKEYDMVYDQLNQLTAVRSSNRNGLLSTTPFSYTYDSAGNKLIEHINEHVVVSSYNDLNQLTKQWTADSLRSGNSILAQLTASPASPSSYDENGNLALQSLTGTEYQWDAADRLVKIINKNSTTEYIYDGLNRRVAEKLNGAVIKLWVWNGAGIAEERGANGEVLKRFFPQGQEINGAKYYYTRDHLGSVREMTDTAGKVRARYSYDPFGHRNKLEGDQDADFGFSGHYFDERHGVLFTLYRAYDPETGKWLSRDPIQEAGGINLYSYADNNPFNKIDELGADAVYINYDGYEVQTGMGFTLPLGHAAVVSINTNNGTTKYFEYGRYDAAKNGIVRQRPVPNVTIGPNGLPTEASLKNLYDYASQHYGKNSPVSAEYHDDADYDKVNKFALDLMNNAERDKYRLIGNNCKTFASDAVAAGKK